MLKAQNLFKSYGDLTVLRNVDIFIDRGELCAILGKSGSGKTTLLQILGSLDKPDSGSIIHNSLDLTKLSQKELAKLRNQSFGFIFQFHHLLKEFSAAENVAMPGLLARQSKKNAFERARYLLDFLGLGDRFNHKPSQLSGGEQQRVAIARALFNEPSIVFADEPTGNLDSQTSENIRNLFIQLNAELKQTFVIVTHQNEMAEICSKQYVMQDGAIKMSNSEN